MNPFLAHMNRSDERDWAKEMVVEGIDRYLHELYNDPVNGAPDLDSQEALLKQRNRVARYLGLPEKVAKDV